MNRDRRHILHIAADEICTQCDRLREEYHEEPDEEARDKLATAIDLLGDAAEALKLAVEIGDETNVAVRAVKPRRRKTEQPEAEGEALEEVTAE